MANTNICLLRQSLTMLSGVAVISMIVASLSIMDGGAERGIGGPLESHKFVDFVDDQAKLQSSDVVAVIKGTVELQCLKQAKPPVFVNRTPWFPV